MITYTCESIGLSGNCGDECPIFLDGDCQNPFEIENTGLAEDEYNEVINDYIERDKAIRLENEKKESMKNNLTFSISKEDVARWLIAYYAGDTSFHNPMKLFLENEAIDADILFMVNGTIKKRNQQALFELDIALNGLNELVNFSRLDMHTIIGALFYAPFSILRGTSIKQITAARKNFYEADLDNDFFDSLDIKLKALFNKDVKNEFFNFYDSVVKHKDFNQNIKMELYKHTGNTAYLPEGCRDLFVF